MIANKIWAVGAENAYKLQEVLNADYSADYEIKYDDGESGLVRCFYKGILYKTVECSAMSAKAISVSDYVAPMPLLTGFIKTQEQYNEYYD